jgi:hypothetical protein
MPSPFCSSIVRVSILLVLLHWSHKMLIIAAAPMEANGGEMMRNNEDLINKHQRKMGILKR